VVESYGLTDGFDALEPATCVLCATALARCHCSIQASQGTVAPRPRQVSARSESAPRYEPATGGRPAPRARISIGWCRTKVEPQSLPLWSFAHVAFDIDETCGLDDSREHGQIARLLLHSTHSSSDVPLVTPAQPDYADRVGEIATFEAGSQ
jgi:hypothetical protein